MEFSRQSLSSDSPVWAMQGHFVFQSRFFGHFLVVVILVHLQCKNDKWLISSVWSPQVRATDHFASNKLSFTGSAIGCVKPRRLSGLELNSEHFDRLALWLGLITEVNRETSPTKNV